MTEENLEVTSRRKKLLYLGLFSFQIMVVFWPMMVGELIQQGRINMSFATMGMIEMIWVLILITTNVFFLKEFVKSQFVFRLIVFIYATSFIITTVARATPSISGDPLLFTRVNMISLTITFFCLWYTFYVAVIDIFKIKHDAVYSLIGAANIFLLIGSLFSFVVAITGSLFPGMVVPSDQAFLLDNQANELAFYTLASIDLPFTDVNPFIRKILVIESIFSHLFVVIIIGRLLSK